MSNRSVVTAVLFLAILIIGFWLGILWRLKRLGDSQAQVGPLLVAQIIDVGHGDAALIHSPDGISLLIDSGPDQSGARKVGIQALRLQLGALQAIILTNARPGSIGGLPYILDNMPVHGPIVLPCSESLFLEEGGEVAKAALDAASRRHLHVFSLDQFESSSVQTALANSIAQTTLIPVATMDPSWPHREENAMAVRIDYGASGLIYAAGLNAQQEDKLIADRVNLPCDVLVATDSASSGTLSSEFLALTQPSVIVISSSADFPPDEQVLARIEAADAEVDRTDLIGTITLGLSDQPSVAPHYYGPTEPPPGGAHLWSSR
jgi:competence protein ComEC